MASSSGTYKEGGNQQGYGSASSYNQNSVHGEWGVPTFQHQKIISVEWTPEEQAVLEEGLAEYASESNIIRYAKIAMQLKKKTVRDVALRCRWMMKKAISKRRKEDLNARKIKDRKEKTIDSSSKPSLLAIQLGSSHAPGVVSNCNDDGISYNDITGPTQQLLQQNCWAFEQISANLGTHQIDENIGLLSQVQDNIIKLLTNLKDMDPTTKKMPALPKLNEELANLILPASACPLQ